MDIRRTKPFCSSVFLFISISKHKETTEIYRHSHTYQQPFIRASHLITASPRTSIPTHRHPRTAPSSKQANHTSPATTSHCQSGIMPTAGTSSSGPQAVPPYTYPRGDPDGHGYEWVTRRGWVTDNNPTPTRSIHWKSLMAKVVSL